MMDAEWMAPPPEEEFDLSFFPPPEESLTCFTGSDNLKQEDNGPLDLRRQEGIMLTKYRVAHQVEDKLLLTLKTELPFMLWRNF